VLDFVHHLMEHHIVKREIKKAEMQESSDEEEGDIFDDFFGGGGATKQKEEKKKEEIKTVEVDKEFLLSIISDYYADKGYSLIGLVLAYENKDIQMSKTSADNLVKHIIVEVVKGSKVDNCDSTDKVIKAIDELVKRFSLKKEDYYIFVRNQYRFLENLRLEFRFIKADKDSATLLFRLEEELMKSINFINVMTSYPFAIDLEKDNSSLKSILSLIEYLEEVVECLFIYENEANEEDACDDDDEEIKDGMFEMPADSRMPSQTVLANTYNDPPRKDGGIGIKKSGRGINNRVRSTISLKKPGKMLKNENSQYMAELCCKLRTSYLLHVSMILLSFLIKKFEYIRPLLNDLRNLMNYTSDKAMGKNTSDTSHSIFTDNLQALANIQIYLKNLKEISNTLLKNAYQKNADDKILNPEYSDEEDANDPFLRNFKNNDTQDDSSLLKKNEEERTNNAENQQKRFDEFLILWLRQIVIYNTHYVLHLAMANQNMMSTLDVKPSIVKASNIKYALLSLMYPRLQAFHQVNNFKSMKRILDNIVSYFFQNFMSLKERGMVIEDLKKVLNNPMKMSQCKYLRFTDHFESNEEFKHFYEFMDMSYYISNVCEFELSLVGHSNSDYSQSTLARVYDVFKNGVEIYKQPGEHITQFCFDNSDNDVCAFVMKEEGIREIKLLQSLTCRNRTEIGLEVFDSEYENWSE
jgi:hypothetical protein